MHLNIVAEPTGLDRTGLHVDLDVCSWLKYFHFHCFFGVLFSFHSINSIFITTRVRRRRCHVDVNFLANTSYHPPLTSSFYFLTLFIDLEPRCRRCRRKRKCFLFNNNWASQLLIEPHRNKMGKLTWLGPTRPRPRLDWTDEWARCLVGRCRCDYGAFLNCLTNFDDSTKRRRLSERKRERETRRTYCSCSCKTTRKRQALVMSY